MAEAHLNPEEFEFILHVIPPPMRLDWSTPRSLFLTTLINHARKDKAPIGHVYTEFTLPTQAASRFSPKIAGLLEGGKRVLTGMTRKKMTLMESLKVVQGERLGLGTFYFDFKGRLDGAEEAREEISWAKKRNRYARIRVKTTEENAETMLSFLKEWIEHGSFHHYSGGLRVDCGEGSGCVEFGMHFLGMALGMQAINPEWMRRVRVPNELIGGGFAGHTKKITVWDIFKDGDRWAFSNEPHRAYSTPDPALMFDWIQARVAGKELSLELTPAEVNWSSGGFVRNEFNVAYPEESLGSIQEQWAKIVEKI